METAFFCFQKTQATVIIAFSATAIHKPPLNPASDFVKKAPDIAPHNRSTAPRNRRFLSAFAPRGAVKSCASLIKSQYKLVRTTVGMALYFSARLATIWPALWKARIVIAAKSDPGNALGMVNVRNSESFRVTTTGGSLGMTAAVVMMATIAMRSVWMAKEETRTQRFWGPKNRWKAEKDRAPSAKHTIAASDFAHEYRGAESGCPFTPRPTKMVLPA